MLIGVVLAYRNWLERSGAETFFGGFGRDSHGSARFAGKKELRTLEQVDDLLVGRNPRTGNRLDAYSRWLRLLVSQALQDIAWDAEGQRPGRASQPPNRRSEACGAPKGPCPVPTGRVCGSGAS